MKEMSFMQLMAEDTGLNEFTAPATLPVQAAAAQKPDRSWQADKADITPEQPGICTTAPADAI